MKNLTCHAEELSSDIRTQFKIFHSFIHLFYKSLLNTYDVPGTVLGAKDISVNNEIKTNYNIIS